MTYRVVLLQKIAGQYETIVESLNITDGLLWKGTKYATPLTNIKYIEEM